METGTLDNTCEICGEPIKTDAYGMYLEEVGEFVAEDSSVIAHAQCGIDAELPLA